MVAEEDLGEKFVDVLRSMVRPDFLVQPDAQGAARLVETAVESRIKPTVLRHAERSVVLRFDACVGTSGGAVDERLFPLLGEGSGWRSSCDYLLVAPSNQKLYVIFIELKTSRAKGAQLQIENTKILIDWLIEAVLLHHKDLVRPDVVPRGIILKNAIQRPRDAQRCPYSLGTPHLKIPHSILPAGEEYGVSYFCPRG